MAQGQDPQSLMKKHHSEQAHLWITKMHSSFEALGEYAVDIPVGRGDSRNEDMPIAMHHTRPGRSRM